MGNIIKIALVHDWVTSLRGGEKVLEALCELYPNADLHTLVYKEGTTNTTIENRRIVPSLLQKMPWGVKRYGMYLPLLPLFAEMIDLSAYDLVISSSHAVAKNVRTKREATHISYIHSPMRYIWEMFDEYFDRYFNKLPSVLYITLNAAIKLAVKPWRWWDAYTAKRIDHILTNSDFVGKRVERYYNRKATTIYPPVDVDEFIPKHKVDKEDFYIVVGALVPYKRVDLVVDAFNESGRRLVVVGKGAQRAKLEGTAKKNIEFKGFLPREEMIALLHCAKAFIYPQVEDFGITAVEAQAAGTPVIAYDVGGAKETVIAGETGLFFSEQTPQSLNQAIERFEETTFHQGDLIRNAERFSKERFKEQVSQVVENTIKQKV